MKLKIHFHKRRYRANMKAWRRRSLRHSKLNLWRAFGRIALAAAAIGLVLFLFVLFGVSRDLPTAEGIVHRTVSQSTKIYDRTGQTVLYNIHGEERRTSVDFKSFPDHLKQATLTAEDRNFYKHRGFRLVSMLRAIAVNVLRGGKLQGGSTITQQFIKNAILGSEKSYIRKIKELFLAYQIERRFSKDEILKLYLNEIPYGSNAYGAEAAAQIFFAKSVKDINLAEAAVLAALPKAPSYYSPWGNNIDDLIARQHYILDGMVEQNYISPDEAEAAKKTKLTFQPRRESIIAPHFVFYVKEQLAALYGERTVERGGLKIITSLDVNKQQLAEEAISESVPFIKRYQASNAALVALDVNSGQIIAMVGSVDYFNNDIQGQVNVAVRPRQPGSSFKPIVYAAALSQGFTPETLIYDVATNFKTDTGVYSPQNYDGKERGPVNLRRALAGSLNIPAVKLLYLAGIKNILDLADQFGYSTLKDRSRFGLSLVLGGAEVKLLEHTAAFAVFAREGIGKPTVSILRVEDSQGNVLQEWRDSPGQRILEIQPVRELTNILSDNEARSYIFGSQNRLNLSGRPVAAKTGTTNDYHDAWTIGYTPQMAVGVWVGNNNNQAMARGADGSVLAAPIWQKFFNQAVRATPVQEFTPPEVRVVDKPMLNGDLGGALVAIDRASGLLATELTPPPYRLNKTFRQYHSLLHYVTPSNPLGPVPDDPNANTQYQNWEEGVKIWMEKQNLKNEFPPTEYDNIHTVDNQPNVAITSPTNNQTITSNLFNFTISATSPRGIKRAEYWLNNVLVATTNDYPFTATIQLDEYISSGYHSLRVIAYDDVDNSNQSLINFNFLSSGQSVAAGSLITSPTNNQIIKTDSSPLIIKIFNQQPERLKQIDLYATVNSEPSQWIGFINSPQKNNEFVWSSPRAGGVVLSLILTSQNGNAYQGTMVNIKITK